MANHNQIAQIRSAMRKPEASCANQMRHAPIRCVMRKPEASCANQMRHAQIRCVMGGAAGGTNVLCANCFLMDALVDAWSCSSQMRHAQFKCVFRKSDVRSVSLVNSLYARNNLPDAFGGFQSNRIIRRPDAFSRSRNYFAKGGVRCVFWDLNFL